MKIQREDLKGRSAFAYCRRAMVLGHPADALLEVYRGDTVAYTVSSLKWGSEHVLSETSKYGFRIKKYKPMSIADKERLRKK